MKRGKRKKNMKLNAKKTKIMHIGKREFNDIEIDDSSCYQKCEGIHVSSYTEKSEENHELSILLTRLSREYKAYKKSFNFQYNLKGRCITNL